MGILLRLLVAAGLAIDAWVHFDFAPDMAGVEGGSIGGDVLFRAQAGVAVLAALLILVLARRWTYAVAFLVAGSAVGAMLFYYAFDLGAIGPLPDMYEPHWYTEKTITLIAEAVATVAAAAGYLTVGAKASRRASGEPESAPA